MAASSKPTGVHVALVFLFLTTVILGIVCYLISKENGVAVAARTKAEDDLKNKSQAFERALDEIGALKQAIGVEFENVGLEEQASETTVLGKLRSVLVATGREQAVPSPQSPNVVGTLQSLRDALNSAQKQLQEKQKGLLDAQAEIDQERAAHVNRATQLENSQQDSETQLQKLVAQRNELLAEKDKEISTLSTQLRSEQVAKEQIRDEYSQFRKAKENEIADLEKHIDFIRQKLNDMEQLSFDKPDGMIVRVDNTTRTVWINLGRNDHLREQTTFSVYTQDHRGVGRGRDDIKAKIEVTKILEGNLAQARILDDDNSRPIRPGDPIYSPAWTRGAKEYFSFIGITDLNGDGKSDRDLLHIMMENAGAGIEVEVDDDGNRIPVDSKLTVKSKYLVRGDLEDPTDFPGADEVKQEQIRKIQEEEVALTREALRKGIRIISFRDFLNYMGYQPQQRLFRPGEDREYNLKYGSRSASTNEELGHSRFSTGNTSARFRKDRKPTQDESGSSTSGLYKP